MKIHVTFHIAAVQKMQRDIPQQVIPTVLARSLNKTIHVTQTAAVKTMASEIGTQQKMIREGLSITPAERQRLTTILSVSHKRRLTLLMIDPHAKQNARGVSYRMGGQQKQIDHAFIATMKNGHRGIYARKPGAGRLPIRELEGLSILHLFMRPYLQQMLKQTVKTQWPPVLIRELRYELQHQGF